MISSVTLIGVELSGYQDIFSMPYIIHTLVSNRHIRYYLLCVKRPSNFLSLSTLHRKQHIVLSYLYHNDPWISKVRNFCTMSPFTVAYFKLSSAIFCANSEQYQYESPVADIINDVSTCQLYLAIRQLIYDKSEIMKWFRCNIHFWIPLFMRRIYTVIKDCTLHIEKCHNSQFHPRSWHKGFADSSLFECFPLLAPVSWTVLRNRLRIYLSLKSCRRHAIMSKTKAP